MSAPVDRINAGLRRIPPPLIYLGGTAYAVWLFWTALTGAIGPDPVNLLERAYGEAALWLLVAGLAVTPLRDRLRLNLLRFRRAIGVTCFGFAVAHLLVFTILDLQSLPRLWTEIVKRPYITVGMLAFLMLLPLAITSNTLSIRRMGAAAWKRLHRLVYPAALLVGLHYIWLSCGFQIEPWAWTGAILALLGLRIRPRRRVATA